MSLPTSESLPTKMEELPPARQRHIRRHPRGASPAERGILLDSLLDQTGPTLNFYLLSFLGSLIFGLSLYFNEPVLLILGLAAFPFLRPVFALALFPHSQKFNHWIKALISILIPIFLAFLAGVFAGYLQKIGRIDRLEAIRFSAPYWLDLAAVAVGSFLCTMLLIRQGHLPRKISMVLAYEIFFPIAIGGFGFPLGINLIWPNALILGLCYLLLAVTIAIFSFLIFSYGPKNVTGWILAIISLLIAAASIFGILYINLRDSKLTISSNPMPANTITNTATYNPSPTSSPTTIASITPTKIFQTRTNTPGITAIATNTISPSTTPSPMPTSFSIVINSINGLVIRESAGFEAPVIGYANDGDLFSVLNQNLSENGSLWYQVETSAGEIGWLLSSMVNTETPIATENN